MEAKQTSTILFRQFHQDFISRGAFRNKPKYPCFAVTSSPSVRFTPPKLPNYHHNGCEVIFFDNEVMTNALIHTPQDWLRTAAGLFTLGRTSANAGMSETHSSLHWSCSTLGFAPLPSGWKSSALSDNAFTLSPQRVWHDSRALSIIHAFKNPWKFYFRNFSWLSTILKYLISIKQPRRSDQSNQWKGKFHIKWIARI